MPRHANAGGIRQSLGLVGWLLVCFAAAGTGAIASSNAGGFYQQLVLPVWAPPASWFGPVWTVLYVLMAVSAWLVWRVGGFRHAGGALLLFLGQLAVNALWTWLFFGWRLGSLAFIEIMLLWSMIIMTMVAFWPIHRIASILLAPYLLWVSFAAALNYAIWHANPQVFA
jgi:benzodiazapine receptor